MTIAESLRAARERIKENGWFRGVSLGDEAVYLPQPGRGNEDCECVATALYRVTNHLHERAAMEYIWRAIGQPETAVWNSGSYRMIHKANDSQPIQSGRDWALSVYDRAILLAEAEGR